MPQENALNSLISQLFQEPQRIQLIMCHFPIAHYSCPAHCHSDLLQFDLLVSLKGSAINEGKKTALSDCVAMVNYPGEKHGYDLDPMTKVGRVFSLKIKVSNNNQAVKQRIFPNIINIAG